MRFQVFSLLLLSTLVGAVTVSDALPPDPNDSIQIVAHAARTTNTGAIANFTGHAQVEQLFAARDASRMTGGIVTFDPGARSVWHTHPVGQILIVTAGSGLVQQWGSAAHIIKAGDVVWIPAGIKHWHGASASSSITHIAVQEMAEGRVVDWLEPVSDAQYLAANQVR